jgi:UDPglucose--hexose-1-phosphate uridylyltransferase
MSSIRQDKLTGRWVILAADRGKRPNDFPLTSRPDSDPAGCPFCPGHESQTPPEVMAIGRQLDAASDTPGWKIRVFPNKYPAVSLEGSGSDNSPVGNDLYPQMPGHGHHEVIVYSPNHNDGPTTLSDNQLQDLLEVVRNRYRFMATVEGVRYVLPFWNHGPEAGATLAHPHLQVIASALVPGLVLEKAKRQEEHYNLHGQCLLCRLLELDTQDGERIIQKGDHFTALSPWASRLPYEMMVLPNRHQSRFAATTDEELADLARVLGAALRGLRAVHTNPPMNVIIHEAPLAESDGGGYGELADVSFHWHLEVLPRLSRMAGFEAGTGFTINSVSAERAARVLRGEGY